MPVEFTDCKKGDTIFFRSEREPEGTKPPGPMGRIGKIISTNKSRQTLLVKCRAVIDGKLTECTWYVRPREVIGFHVV